MGIKPIFIVKIPGGSGLDTTNNLIKSFRGQILNEIREEYHVLIIIDYENTELKFEMYSPLASDPIAVDVLIERLEELKKKCEDSINKITSNETKIN